MGKDIRRTCGHLISAERVWSKSSGAELAASICIIKTGLAIHNKVK